MSKDGKPKVWKYLLDEEMIDKDTYRLMMWYRKVKAQLDKEE